MHIAVLLPLASLSKHAMWHDAHFLQPVPLHDTYFADPIAKLFHDDFEGDVTLELFGVLIGGRTRVPKFFQYLSDLA